ncbi:MAG: VapC toxin family PIN domain ribonuclease [Acidimicrobiales bacterium]|nr:MAG: VapC toxin family PIN domain ribonuclease [Acidimicrobiales bacterium]
MILVDTSVWVDHFRSENSLLTELLQRLEVCAHPWVTGELALGNLRQRVETIGLLNSLPQATLATNDEVMKLISAELLYGIGIGYVDAQLLAAARLTPGVQLWTQDKRLEAAAVKLGCAYSVGI